jgi:UDP-N-acetylmuramate--alanine ligase
MDISNIQSVHMVGIKGAGMTGLAKILKLKGLKITGSDVAEEFFTDAILKRHSIPFWEYGKKSLPKCDLVITWSACPDNDPEVLAARKRNIPVLRYPEAIAKLFNQKFGIAVCGTHGKTTTTALAGIVLTLGGLDPTVVLGSEVELFEGNSRAGASDIFVLEACEYQRHFLKYSPRIVILTNIEMDHPDCYKNLDDVKETFKAFIEKIPKDGLLIACTDNNSVKEILPYARCRVVTYGLEAFAPHCCAKASASRNSDYEHYQAIDICTLLGKTKFKIMCPRYLSRDLVQMSLQIPGRHNVANATAAAILGRTMGLSWPSVKKALESYAGAKRRFEKLGEAKEILVYDDYAHHPTEIKATLAAARTIFPKQKIWCIFQPHTFSRTASLFEEFAKSFKDAQEVILADIFSSAREKDTGEISSEKLIAEIQKHHPNAIHYKSFDRILTYLLQKVKSGDIVITMGAGDIYKVGERLLAELKNF